MSNELKEPKISVYIALVMAGLVSMTDLVANGNVTASQTITLALLAFAGGRQVLKSALGK